MATKDIGELIKRIVKRLDLIYTGQSEEDKFQISRQKAVLWLMTTIRKFKKQETHTNFDFLIKYPGSFYMFQYESSLYESGKLPFYDAYPLIFVLSVSKESFLGINFHWILPRYRAIVLKKLLLFYGDKFLGNKLLRPASYNMFIKIMGGHKKHAKAATRMYLRTHLIGMRGIKAMRIDNTDMFNSILYVSPRFIGITEKKAEKHIKSLI